EGEGEQGVVALDAALDEALAGGGLLGVEEGLEAFVLLFQLLVRVGGHGDEGVGGRRVGFGLPVGRGGGSLVGAGRGGRQRGQQGEGGQKGRGDEDARRGEHLSSHPEAGTRPDRIIAAGGGIPVKENAVPRLPAGGAVGTDGPRLAALRRSAAKL